jgi:hypothetical protein
MDAGRRRGVPEGRVCIRARRQQTTLDSRREVCKSVEDRSVRTVLRGASPRPRVWGEADGQAACGRCMRRGGGPFLGGADSLCTRGE